MPPLSNRAERVAARLSLGTAVAVALGLLLVGWTFYRPAPAERSPAVGAEAAAEP